MNNHIPNQQGSSSTAIEPAPTDDVQRIADEQFAHGLLQFLHRDTRAVQDARITQAMNALRSETERSPVAGRIKIKRSSWRGVTAAAASLMLVAVLAMLGLPTDQTAHAMVQASIEASAEAGPRRYEVRAQHPYSDDDETEPIATLDLHGVDRMLFRAQSPHGHRLVVGRNPGGHWAVRPDGAIEHFDARRPWPRWAEFSDRTLLLESVDSLLKRLSKDYNLQYVQAVSNSKAESAKPFDQITATRTDGPRQFPDRIELQLDPATHIVQRMELHWSFERLGLDAERMRRHRARRHDTAGADEAPSDEPRLGERRRRRMHGDDGQAKRNPSQRQSGIDDQPPHDRIPRRRDPSNSDGDLRSDDGHRPRFLDRAPEFRDGRNMPPPRVIIFELVDQPEFSKDWFDPETHVD